MATTLKRITYKPNFKHATFIDRAERALRWCDEMRLFKRDKQAHRNVLFDVFGNTSRQPGRWLRHKLLHQMGGFKPGSHSYSYRLNLEGYQEVYALLKKQPPSEIAIVMDRFGDLINGAVEIKYDDKGNRRYHPIQNIKREIRKQAFADWWDYDIEACAATLVHQYAVKHYRHIKGGDSTVEPFPTVARIIHDKAAVREHIAALTGLDAKAAKDLIQMLLFRAVFAPHHRSRAFQMLRGDESIYYRFVNDPFVAAFRHEVKSVWHWARQHYRYERARRFLQGETLASLPGRDSKVRMEIYLSLERRVIDAMLNGLRDQGAPVFLMHDGFMTKRRVVVAALERTVLSQTGFAIKLKEEQLCEGLEDEGSDLEEVMENDAGELDDELGAQDEAVNYPL